MPARSYQLFQVNAFTQHAFCGNPAGVVLGAAELSEAQMQLVARELNYGDAAFVLPSTGPDHDLRLRFFTPTRELAFVGHASLAAHFVRATMLGQRAATQRQLSGTGLVDIDQSCIDGRIAIGIRQPPAQLRGTLSDSGLDKLLDVLGLERSDLDPRCPAEIYSKGGSRLLLGLRDAAVLAGLRPDEAALARLSMEVGAEGFFLFALTGQTAACLTEARMFCPAIGIPEDPVSGNAHAMLGVYLLSHGLLPLVNGRAAFRGAQGQAVGRPGSVSVELAVHAGAVQSVRISGTAVVVFESTLTL